MYGKNIVDMARANYKYGDLKVNYVFVREHGSGISLKNYKKTLVDTPKQVMFVDMEFNNDSDSKHNRSFSDLISIGCYVYKKYKGKMEQIYEYYSLVKSYKNISPHITELTGIKQKDVNNAPKIDKVFSKLMPYIESSDIIIYYGDNDVRSLLNGSQNSNLGVRKMVCKMVGVKLEAGTDKMFTFNLQSAYYCVDGYTEEETHNALDDARLLSCFMQNFLCENDDGVDTEYIMEILKYYDFRQAIGSLVKGYSLLRKEYSEDEIEYYIKKVKDGADMSKCSIVEYFDNYLPAGEDDFDEAITADDIDWSFCDGYYDD